MVDLAGKALAFEERGGGFGAAGGSLILRTPGGGDAFARLRVPIDRSQPVFSWTFENYISANYHSQTGLLSEEAFREVKGKSGSNLRNYCRSGKEVWGCDSGNGKYFHDGNRCAAEICTVKGATAGKRYSFLLAGSDLWYKAEGEAPVKMSNNVPQDKALFVFALSCESGEVRISTTSEDDLTALAAAAGIDVVLRESKETREARVRAEAQAKAKAWVEQDLPREWTAIVKGADPATMSKILALRHAHNRKDLAAIERYEAMRLACTEGAPPPPGLAAEEGGEKKGEDEGAGAGAGAGAGGVLGAVAAAAAAGAGAGAGDLPPPPTIPQLTKAQLDGLGATPIATVFEEVRRSRAQAAVLVPALANRAADLGALVRAVAVVREATKDNKVAPPPHEFHEAAKAVEAAEHHNEAVAKAAGIAEAERSREALSALRKALDGAAAAGIKEAGPDNEGIRTGRATEARVKTWLDRVEALSASIAEGNDAKIMRAVQVIQKGRAETGTLPFAKELRPVLTKLVQDAPKTIADVVKTVNKYGLRIATEWSFAIRTVAQTIRDDEGPVGGGRGGGGGDGGAGAGAGGGGGVEEQKGGDGDGDGGGGKALDEDTRKVVEEATKFADTLEPHEKAVSELYPVIRSADDVISKGLEGMKKNKADLIRSLGPPWLAEHAGVLITWLCDPEGGDSRDLAAVQESIEDKDLRSEHIKRVIDDVADQKLNIKAENVYFQAFEQAVKDTQEEGEKKVADRDKSAHKFPFAKLRLGLPIGRGQYGQVFAAELRIKIGAAEEVKKVAAKTVDKRLASPAAIDDQIVETERNAKVASPNVVTCYGWTESDDKKQYFMLSELMDGSVLSLLRQWRTAGRHVTAGSKLVLLMGPALGLAKLHMDKMIHRDIAARNVCYKKGLAHEHQLVVKVVDLGLARDVDDGGEYALTILDDGTLRLAIPIDRTAPECLVTTRDGADGKCKIIATRENDVFALSIYFWEVLTCGLTPYEEHKDGRYEQALVLDVPKHVKAGGRLNVPDTGLLKGLGEVMGAMWHQDYTQRPTMSKVVQYLWDMVPWSGDEDKVKDWLRGLGVPEGHEALDEIGDGDVIFDMCSKEKDLTDFLDEAFKNPADAGLKDHIRGVLEEDAVHIDKDLIADMIAGGGGGPAGEGQAEGKGR